MRIIFSDHALVQIQERKLSTATIVKTVKKPKRIIQQSAVRYKAIAEIVRNGKRYALVVVYDIQNASHEIVTAFITSKAKKYL